jgi:branched-subunit amino acid transport protein
MDQKVIFITILGMASVTYLPRLLPVYFLSSRSLPPLAVAWLRFVPVAVLAAMLFPSLLVQEHKVVLGPSNFFLWAALPTLLVAVRTRSLFSSVIVGMIVVTGAHYVFGL